MTDALEDQNRNEPGDGDWSQRSKPFHSASTLLLLEAYETFAVVFDAVQTDEAIYTVRVKQLLCSLQVPSTSY